MARFDCSRLSAEDKAFGHWLAGFTAAEACFSLWTGTNVKQMGEGYRNCKGNYSITLRRDDKEILETIRDYLFCGGVWNLKKYKESEGTPKGRKPQARFEVTSSVDLAVTVAKVFDAFPIRAKKSADFAIWKEGVNFLYRVKLRPHNPKWTKQDVDKFACLEDELKEVRQFKDGENQFQPGPLQREGFADWLTGFVDGDGYFQATFRSNGTGRSGLKHAKFGISLRSDDSGILKQIREFLGCGKIYHVKANENPTPGFENSKGQTKLEVDHLTDLTNIVIPLFEKHPLRSKKAKDFDVWKRLVRLMHAVKERPKRSRGMAKGGKGLGFYPTWNSNEQNQFLHLYRALINGREYEGPPDLELSKPIPIVRSEGFLDWDSWKSK